MWALEIIPPYWVQYWSYICQSAFIASYYGMGNVCFSSHLSETPNPGQVSSVNPSGTIYVFRLTQVKVKPLCAMCHISYVVIKRISLKMHVMQGMGPGHSIPK